MFDFLAPFSIDSSTFVFFQMIYGRRSCARVCRLLFAFYSLPSSGIFFFCKQIIFCWPKNTHTRRTHFPSSMSVGYPGRPKDHHSLETSPVRSVYLSSLCSRYFFSFEKIFFDNLPNRYLVIGARRNGTFFKEEKKEKD